jgi:hypothetical protein
MRAIVGPLIVIGILVALWVFVIDRNPGGISDARYSKYQRLSAPKLLYSCTRRPTDEARLRKSRECMTSGRAGCEQEVYDWGEATIETTVDFIGNQGESTYSELLQKAKQQCARNIGDMGDGKIEVLKASED